MESPDFYVGSYFNAGGDNQFSQDSLNNFHHNTANNNHHHFTIDDLLDFSKGDDIITDSFFEDITPHSSLPAFDSINSSSSGSDSQFNNCSSFTDAQFSGKELFVPYNDLPELEWISNFENESFSSGDFQNFQFISATTAPADTSSSQSADEFRPKSASNRNYSPIFGLDKSIPGKARSKRSRAAPCDWSSRILFRHSVEANNGTNFKTAQSKGMEDPETTARKCVHCGSVKTPQWRTGPMGPKTLCNACGVRHQSGRLVPEYRPAASPTFVSARHSNSHRKVVELRRQKELQIAQQQQQQQEQLFSQSSIFSTANGDDYLIR